MVIYVTEMPDIIHESFQMSHPTKDTNRIFIWIHLFTFSMVIWKFNYVFQHKPIVLSAFSNIKYDHEPNQQNSNYR